ncbi:ATP-binding cassette domain-containing protein [Flavobacterium sp. JP2137]|uniref:ATP-binding cassette domain-containing protein n=1 Tax=Flavobacterium sp. JP2137 TaxID=3414510 RepID=UPI003D2FF072
MVHQLTAESIVKHRDRRAILTDVALSCKTGDIVGLLGRNGCGKTTLLNIIYGTLPCEHKYLAIDRVKVNQPFSLPKTLNYLPQHRFIPKHLTVTQAVSLFLDSSEKAAVLEDGLVQSMVGKKIRELAFGDLRYLEIKLLLTAPSKFSLLDEPFQGLAPLIVESVQELIVQASQNRGIILVDHNYTSVLQLSTKLYVLDKSSLHALKSPDDLVQYTYQTPS